MLFEVFKIAKAGDQYIIPSLLVHHFVAAIVLVFIRIALFLVLSNSRSCIDYACSY